jgi:hypothetical protein
MGLLDRLRGREGTPADGRSSLAADAGAVRDTLDGLYREGGGAPLSLRDAVRDLLEGEVEAPTADVASLRSRATDPDDFYAREVAPSWDGLNEAQRAARLDGFLEMCAMLEGSADLMGVPPEMAASVRTKTLLIAWAFDEEYGYLSRLARRGTLEN